MERIDLDPGHGQQKRISLLFGNQRVYLRPVSADKEEWVTADHEEAGSEDLCFLTETTPEEVIEHLKSCGVAVVDCRRTGEQAGRGRLLEVGLLSRSGW